MRKGISQPAPEAPPIVRAPARRVSSSILPPIQIASSPHEAPRTNMPPQGMLVNAEGKPIRGLSAATIAARNAVAQSGGEEMCPNCGQMRQSSHMRNIVENALIPNNVLRICDVPGDPMSCAKLTYKRPDNTDDKWKPAIPRVRFDQETAAPYDAKARQVKLPFLLNSDTHRSEAEADKYTDAFGNRLSTLHRPINEGTASRTDGIGHRPRLRR